MKTKHNEIELNVSDNAFATGGSFPADGGTYSGHWYEANATDNDGNEYRVIWTKVNWDAEDGADACDWLCQTFFSNKMNSPDYILQA
jgi:hypothetical protein